MAHLPLPEIHCACGRASGSSGVLVGSRRLRLVPPGFTSTRPPPPLSATTSLSLLGPACGSVITCVGEGPTSNRRMSLPVDLSNTLSQWLNHSVWYRYFSSLSVHMLCGLFMLISGAAILRTTFQVVVSIW